jgi:ABC-type polysaccharide/polyol phosphate export permease
MNKVYLYLVEFYHSRSVLYQLVAQQLTLRYRRTVLGYLWTLINPLLMMSVIAIVFSSLFKTDLRSFAVFLFAGMVPWIFFNSVVAQSCSAYINNEGLIKKIYLPKMIFPVSIALSNLIDSVLSFIALFLIILILGGRFSMSILFLPISFLLLFCFCLGIGLILSIATVFFRDLQHVVLIALQGVFFLTPIFYKNDVLGGKLAWLVAINPVTPFIDLFRLPLVDGMFPNGEIIFNAFFIAICSMILGLFVFVRFSKKIIFRL